MVSRLTLLYLLFVLYKNDIELIFINQNIKSINILSVL
jgi:hypothetical protein